MEILTHKTWTSIILQNPVLCIFKLVMTKFMECYTVIYLEI